MKRAPALGLMLVLSSAPVRAEDGNLMFSSLMAYGGVPIQLDVPDDIRNYLLVGLEWEVVFFDVASVFVNADFLLPAELVTYGACGFKYHFAPPGEGLDPYAGIGLGFTAGGTITYGDGITSEFYAYPDFSFVATGGVTYWLSNYLGIYGHGRVHVSGGIDLIVAAGGLSLRLFSVGLQEAFPSS